MVFLLITVIVINFFRMSFNNSVSDTSSGTCLFAPIRQTDERSRLEDQRSEVESGGQVTSTTDPEQTGVSSTVAEPAEEFDDVILSGHTAEDPKNSNHQTSSVKESYIDDTATVLNSFSLGGPTLKRNNSGMLNFSLTSVQAYMISCKILPSSLTIVIVVKAESKQGFYLVYDCVLPISNIA